MRGGRKEKNQLTAAPGVLNTQRHNLKSGHNVPQRRGASKDSKEWDILRGIFFFFTTHEYCSARRSRYCNDSNYTRRPGWAEKDIAGYRHWINDIYGEELREKTGGGGGGGSELILWGKKRGRLGRRDVWKREMKVWITNGWERKRQWRSVTPRRGAVAQLTVSARPAIMNWEGEKSLEIKRWGGESGN